jgi:subtilase family serine protease
MEMLVYLLINTQNLASFERGMLLKIRSLFRWRVIVPLMLMAIAMSVLPVVSNTFAAGNPTHSSSHASINRSFRQHFKLLQTSIKPPTYNQCLKLIGFPCYSPQLIRKAYGVTPVLNNGFTGKGQSIVIIDSFGSPTIRQDLKVFDQGYGLPDPPSLKILSPLGKINFDPTNSDMVGWAVETTLDVEWSHALAPDANIVLMTSPVSETEGVQGLPEFLFLEKYAVSHNLGKIVSQSWAATENTLFNPGGRQIFNQFNDFYKQAGQEGVTFFASSGDSGSSNVDINGNTYPFPTVGFPTSSPYVTSVGGTSLFASNTGNYQSETVWDEVAQSAGAGGGGISQVFKEPNYQQTNLPASDQSLLNGFRGVPDISYNADPLTGILVYLSFIPNGAGFYLIGGTSEGSPQWAGIIADADQMAGHPLGFLNPALYQLGNSNKAANSYHDITVGNNGYNNIPGYDATPGWDPASGWGSPRVSGLLPALIKAIG